MPTLTRFMRVIIAIDGEDSAPRVITAYPIVRSRTASRDTEIAAPSDLKVDEAFAKRVQTKLSNVTGRPAAPDPSQPERESRLKFSNEERLRRKAVLSEELKGQVQLEDMRHNISITLAAEREAKGVLRDRRRAEAAARLEEAAAAKRDAKRSKKAEAPVKAEPEPQSWWSSAFSRLFSW